MGDMPVGAHQMSQTEMRGGSYPGPEDIDTELEQVLPTVQGYANPGATINLRGVEANTDMAAFSIRSSAALMPAYEPPPLTTTIPKTCIPKTPRRATLGQPL